MMFEITKIVMYEVEAPSQAFMACDCQSPCRECKGNGSECSMDPAECGHAVLPSSDKFCKLNILQK